MTTDFFVISSKLAFQSPYFTIRLDQVAFPSGRVGEYYVMERPPFSAVVAVDDMDRVCLINAFRHPVRGRFWELPQGSEEGRHEPLEVAKTELREEAGQQASSWERLGLLHEAYGYSDARCTVFRATGLSDAVGEPQDSEGELRKGWFSADEIWELVRAGAITDAVTIAAFAMSQSRNEKM